MAKKRSKKMDKYLDHKENETAGSFGYLKGNPDSLEISAKTLDDDAIEMDIVPYLVTQDNHPFAEVDETWYEKTFEIHRNIGPEEKVVICPRSVGKRCPICEYIRDARRDPSHDPEEINAIKAKKRQIFNVKVGKKIYVWDVSIHLFGLLLDKTIKLKKNHRKRPEPEVMDFFELEQGRTLEVTFKEKSFAGNDFFEAIRVDFYERDEIDEDVLEKTMDLDSLLVVLGEKELRDMFTGVASEDDADDDQDDEPKPKRKKRKAKKEEEEPDEEEEKPKRKKRKAKKETEEEEEETKPRRRRRKKKEEEEEETEDEPNDDEDEQEEEEEEEEEKPKRRSRRTRRAKAEEEETEEEEEEEEEKPKRKKRKAKKKEDECPHDHDFGDDCEEQDECEDCDLWEACKDAQEANK